jgi:uncharacterized protein YndB with AHSA1/START domain
MLAYIVVALLVIGMVTFIQTRPSTFSVSRSKTISAPPAVIFSYLDDLRKWQEFSPWAKVDPAAKIIYQGPARGVGAAFSWAGNHNVGAGSMTVIDSQPPELIQYRLDFLKPFKGTSTAEFRLTPTGNDTVVTWRMFGDNNFIAKALSLVMNCDKMMGGQFEQGLTTLKTLSEASSK